MDRTFQMICKCSCGCREDLGEDPRIILGVTSETGGPRCVVCNYGQHFDAPKRASDVVRLHLIGDRELAINSWVAIRMSDGGSDGALYPTKHQAVRGQLHEYQCAYVEIPPDGFSPRAAEIYLRFNRQLYGGGMRLADPDKDLEVIMPIRKEMLS